MFIALQWSTQQKQYYKGDEIESFLSQHVGVNTYVSIKYFGQILSYSPMNLYLT